MSTVKKTISIDEHIANEASHIAPNFSATVETALIEYLRQYRINKAMNSFGKWEKRNIDSVDIVNNLRIEETQTPYVTKSKKRSKKTKK